MPDDEQDGYTLDVDEKPTISARTSADTYLMNAVRVWNDGDQQTALFLAMLSIARALSERPQRDA